MSYYMIISFQIYQITHAMAPEHGITDLPTFKEIFWIPIVSAFALFAFKRQLENISTPVFLLICKDQDNIEKMKERAEKAAIALYKYLVYLGGSCVGYYLLKDSEILPWYLGGTGSLKNCFTNTPFQPQIKGLLQYSLFQLGYYLEDIVNNLFFRERTSDFWEMNLHHFITITLFGGMILQNFIRPGVICSWLHSLSDISTAGSRVLSHTVYSKSTAVSFIMCTVFWFLLRNICIPLLCYNCWLYLEYPPELAAYNNAPKLLTALLTVLCFMHVYWLVLFIRMIAKSLKTGNTDD